LNAKRPDTAKGGAWRLDARWQVATVTPTSSSASDPQHALAGLLALPFDAVRALYGTAVEYRLVRPSMLASQRLERTLDMLERLSLGPFARSV
jgi:hypothetical protein